ncbi:hypothetical protein A2U01_0026327, partial [Trifolium medium]|nr:hypothetical protein [Trifolium medium]
MQVNERLHKDGLGNRKGGTSFPPPPELPDYNPYDDNNVVEVEMIEKIRNKILASKLGFMAALHLIAKWLQ